MALPAAGTALGGHRIDSIVAGKYRIVRRLGRGGMGEVYEAVHVDILRRFAIKFLRIEYAGDAGVQVRFKREAQAAAALSSDHVVEIIDFGHAEDEAAYIVMELLDGMDLRSMLRQAGRFGVEQAVDLVRQACAGVAVAHRAGIIHRDLKPENLFVVARGERSLLKVLDFGIAKLQHESLGTTANGLLGTPAYMAPEQVRRAAGVDERIDVYALGAILYQLLSGALPHPGENEHEVIAHLLFERTKPLRELEAAVPVELEEIVHQAIAPSPTDRHESVEAFASALAPFAAAATNLAERVTAPGRDSRVASESLPVQSRTRRDRAHLRRALWIVPLLVLGAGLAWARLSRTEITAPSISARAVAGPAQGPSFDAATPVAPRSAETLPRTETSPLADSVERSAERPHAHPGAPSPGRKTATAPSTVIEVRRGDRTIVFKRNNPLRR